MERLNKILVTARWAIIAVAILLGLKLATGTTSYVYRIEYAGFPADDGALVRWLNDQPRVSNAAVTRDGKTLAVTFSVPTSGGSVPDVVGKAEQLGYQQRGNVTSSNGVHLW